MDSFATLVKAMGLFPAKMQKDPIFCILEGVFTGLLTPIQGHFSTAEKLCPGAEATDPAGWAAWSTSGLQDKWGAWPAVRVSWCAWAPGAGAWGLVLVEGWAGPLRSMLERNPKGGGCGSLL